MNGIVGKSCAMFARAGKEISSHRKRAKYPCAVDMKIGVPPGRPGR